MINWKERNYIIKKIINFFSQFIVFFEKKNYYEISSKNYYNYFGYHDKIPFSKDNKRLLLHLGEKKKNIIKVGFFNIKENKIKLIDQTKAWSWQLGSMLQWVDGNNSLIFNCLRKKKLVSKLINIKDKKFHYYKLPIYCLNKQGTKALSINFKKLYNLRLGYGYNYNNNIYLNKNSLNDGIYLLNLINKNYKKILDFKKIILFLKLKKNDNYYINHITFSPNSDSITFYFILANTKIRKIYPINYNLNKKKFLLIEKNYNFSHYCWISNNELLVSCHDSLFKFEYYVYNLSSNKKKKIQLNLNKDGHPMLNPRNKDLVVSDTYPNIFGFQKLFIFSISKKKIIWQTLINSRFYKFNFHKRCDLHPRWNYNGNSVSIDTVANGDRSIRIYKFKSNKIL